MGPSVFHIYPSVEKSEVFFQILQEGLLSTSTQVWEELVINVGDFS